jgi:hypothetical protein
MRYDDEVMVETQGKFKYNYCNAIDNFISTEDSSTHTSKVRILENGISEELPYHLLTPASSKKRSNFSDISNQILEEREEIKEAKLFFLPLDNLLYKQRWFNEFNEFSSLSGISFESINFSFFDFLYHQHQSIKLFPDLKNILFKYIPHSHQFLDQENFIANIFYMCLGIKCLVGKSKEITFIESNEVFSLSSWILGKNTVLGGGVYQVNTTYNVGFFINDYEEAIKFYSDGYKDIFDILEGYFFNAQSSVQYKYLPTEEYQSEVNLIGFNFQI